jgi:PDZ domain-containing secreted protein
VPVVRVDGPTTYPPEGEVLFLTVTLRHVSLLQAVQGWLDPDVSVLPAERLLGNQTDEENRIVNQRLMADSKDTAAEVALARLGFPLTPTGTGATVTDLVE